MRSRNLDKATFEEKSDLVTKLGIQVYPSEDLKSMKVKCQLNLNGQVLSIAGTLQETPKAKGRAGCQLSVE